MPMTAFLMYESQFNFAMSNLKMDLSDSDILLNSDCVFASGNFHDLQLKYVITLVKLCNFLYPSINLEKTLGLGNNRKRNNKKLIFGFLAVRPVACGALTVVFFL